MGAGHTGPGVLLRSDWLGQNEGPYTLPVPILCGFSESLQDGN